MKKMKQTYKDGVKYCKMIAILPEIGICAQKKNILPVFYCYNLSFLALPIWFRTIQSPVT